ncbi:MAG: RodZ family helix-turn-helix domain-containing protein [Synechococcales bacterium]|nr:RodZ family helix-turn-helix domain-containing protein [Synechococcales bacterium]
MNHDVPYVEQNHQSEKLAQIGDYLRQVREERAVSIEQVSAQTMIQARLLRAIETGDLNQLPEPVYIQGFIRRYAEVLGLNGAELAHAFPTTPDIHAIQPSWKSSAAAQLRPLHLYAAYVALIVAAVSGLSYLLTPALTRTASVQQSSPRESQANPSASAPAQPSVRQTAEPAPATAIPSEATAPAQETTSPASEPSVQNIRPQPSTDKPVQVALELTERSWLRVIVDGQKDFEGVLPEGTQRTWTADSQLTVRAGNAGGVLLTHNQGDAQVMGDPGSVQEVTFSADTPETGRLSASEPTATPAQAE